MRQDEPVKRVSLSDAVESTRLVGGTQVKKESTSAGIGLHLAHLRPVEKIGRAFHHVSATGTGDDPEFESARGYSWRAQADGCGRVHDRQPGGLRIPLDGMSPRSRVWPPAWKVPLVKSPVLSMLADQVLAAKSTVRPRSLGKLRRTKLDSGRAVFLGNAERFRSSSLGEDYPTKQYFLGRRGTCCGFPMSRDSRIHANFWWPWSKPVRKAGTMAAWEWVEFSATVLRFSSTCETPPPRLLRAFAARR